MEKKPFVTREQLEEIKKHTRHRSTCMMKRESARMASADACIFLEQGIQRVFCCKGNTEPICN